MNETANGPQLHTATVVLAAQGHSPLQIHPDFLLRHGIVKKDWEVEDTITTANRSMTRYKGGLQIQVDQDHCCIRQ